VRHVRKYFVVNTDVQQRVIGGRRSVEIVVRGCVLPVRGLKGWVLWSCALLVAITIFVVGA